MALSISSSEQALGSDGPWYTFVIQVGTSQQTVFVLPSTSLRQILLVVPQGCEQDSTLYGISDTSCVSKRGGDWNASVSSTYSPDLGTEDYFSYAYSVEQVLNSSLPSKDQYGGVVQAGEDTVKFGFEGSDTTALQNQLVLGYAATNPYLGTLPLSPYNSTVANLTDTHFSVVGALNASSALPSRSWAYNAGAPYRNAFGSLTLGGYDSNRGNVDNVLEVSMNPVSDHELEVTITSIDLHTNSGTTPASAGSLSIITLLDSTIPEIWLPQEICAAFEDVFGITWDSNAELYLVNDTLHESLMAQNASVTFTLAPNASYTSATVDIQLPYASFNLTAAYPLAGINDSTTTLRYFPLKRAADSSQYFLGRTFFQEAYVSANYDLASFNVSQATFEQPRANLVTMYPYQVTIEKQHNNSLTGGAIAGIVIGVLAILAIVAGLGWWCWRRRGGRSIRSWARNVPGTSVGATSTTIDVSQEHDRRGSNEEFYKPPVPLPGAAIDPTSEDESARKELDATETVRPRHLSYDRAELPAGSIRRASDQSRASRPSISPLDPRSNSARYGHFSMNSGFSSTHSGYGSPQFGGESPPVHDARSPSPSGLFELHGHSRGPSDDSIITHGRLSELDAKQERQRQQQIAEAGEMTPRDPRVNLQSRWGEGTMLEHHAEHDEEATVAEKDPLVEQEENTTTNAEQTVEHSPAAAAAAPDPEKQG